MVRRFPTHASLPSSANQARFLAAAGLIALLGGLGVIVGASGGTAQHQPQFVKLRTQAAAVKQESAHGNPRPELIRIVVTGVGAYDPEGDGSENDRNARLATDGKPATAWKSEHYRSRFFKSGVGLVVDAGRPVKAERLIVTTETPGFKVQVRVGGATKGPFATVSKSMITSPTTSIAVRPHSGRYFMLWITSMPEGGTAAVNEVSVTVKHGHIPKAIR